MPTKRSSENDLPDSARRGLMAPQPTGPSKFGRSRAHTSHRPDWFCMSAGGTPDISHGEARNPWIVLLEQRDRFSGRLTAVEIDVCSPDWSGPAASSPPSLCRICMIIDNRPNVGSGRMKTHGNSGDGERESPSAIDGSECASQPGFGRSAPGDAGSTKD